MRCFFLLVAVGLIGSIHGQNGSELIATAFYCRIRLTNVSEEIADAVLSQNMHPEFEVVPPLDPKSVEHTTFWSEGDEDEEPGMIEAVYLVLVDDGKVIGIKYPDTSPFSALHDNQWSIRCSNASIFNTSQDKATIVYTESYIAKLRGPPVSEEDSVRRRITLEHQTQRDCNAVGGYLHPYTLDEWGHRYVANGETFNHGCSYVGTCRNGEQDAVPRCSPSQFPSTVQAVQKAGACCQQTVVKAAVEEAGCPKAESGSVFDQLNPEMYVPWQVRFGTEDGMECDGVIVSKHWFLTTRSCIVDGFIEFIRPAAIRMQPTRFRNVTIIETKSVAANDSVDLALAKLNLPFVIDEWTTAVQRVNLPWSQSMCQKHLEKDCWVFLGTEQRDEARDPIVIPAVITDTDSFPLVKKQANKPIILGSGAVSWFEQANFLVGIYTGSSKTTMTDDKVVLTEPWGDDAEEGNLISICPFLESIGQVIKGDD